MYSMVKRVSVFALALLTLVMGIVVPFRRAEAATTYNNTIQATLNCSIGTNGKLNAVLGVTGIKGKTTHVSVALYVEKRILGVFWSKVDIGCDNNTWTDSYYGYSYDNTFRTDISSSGTYRVTVTYTVSGSGGSDDIITMTDIVTY